LDPESRKRQSYDRRGDYQMLGILLFNETYLSMVTQIIINVVLFALCVAGTIIVGKDIKAIADEMSK
jgi:hypothetical protein